MFDALDDDYRVVALDLRGHDHMTAFQDPELVAAIRTFVRKHPSDAVRDASGWLRL